MRYVLDTSRIARRRMLMRDPLLAEERPGAVMLRHVLPALIVIVCAIAGGVFDERGTARADACAHVPSDGPQYRCWLDNRMTPAGP